MKRSQISLCLTLITLTVALVPAAKGAEVSIWGGGGGGLAFEPSNSLGPATFYGQGIATQVGKCAWFTDLNAAQLQFLHQPVPMNFTLFGYPANHRPDHLYAEVDSEFDAETGILIMTLTFNGGTGRFEHATGSATLAMLIDGWEAPFDLVLFEWQIEGSIEY
jgi:hypothetical protein